MFAIPEPSFVLKDTDGEMYFCRRELRRIGMENDGPFMLHRSSATVAELLWSMKAVSYCFLEFYRCTPLLSVPLQLWLSPALSRR
jgi:hypothetical protein